MQYRRLKKKDRIYISGPISRDPAKARSGFARVERWLRWNGQDSIINPEKLLREQARTMSHGELLHICRSLVETSDVVLLLEDWRSSTGACMEAGMALALHKLVLEIREDGTLRELNY